MITQKELKESLHYNPNTGIFTRLKSGGTAKKGSVAGGLNNRGYIHIRVGGKKHLAHRLAFLYMTGKFPEDQIDHINHIRDDNRWLNLRKATNQDNKKNSTLYKNNTSGTAGVRWHKPSKRWEARIGVNCKLKNLGTFVDRFEAICVRKSAENKHGFHGNHGK